jgi:predicted permease
VVRIFEKMRVWLLMLFHRKRTADRLDKELQFHLEQQIAENIVSGMNPEEAEHAAMRLFGNPAVFRDQITEKWSWTWLENLRQDAGHALRQFRHSPSFVLISVLTLTLGIGANTAIFTLMNSLWLQSLPVRDPNRLVLINVQADHPSPVAQSPMPVLNLPLIESIERHTRSFSGIFGWCDYGADLLESDATHTYPGTIVSGNIFDVLGVRPAAGRLLTAADDQPGGGPDGWAVVISHRFWVQHYAADPSVIGRQVQLNGYSVTIVGVAPENFEGIMVSSRPDFYMPLNYEPVMRQRQRDSMLRNPLSFNLTPMARLKAGITVAQAAAELSAVTPQVLEEVVPAAVIRRMHGLPPVHLTALPGRSGWSFLRIRYRQPLFLMQGLVGIVLLICCANLAGLGLARAVSRSREFALRVALGAPRPRLMRQVLIESLLLTLPGGLLGLGFAWMGCRLLLRLLSVGAERFPIALSIRPDATVLTVTAGCAVFCALLCGMAPAWMLSHTAPEPMLRQSGNRSLRAECKWVGNSFVCAQIALSLMLVVVAGLLSTTLIKLRLGHAGFRTENISTVMMDLRARSERGTSLTHIYWQMAERLKQMPGVQNAALVTVPPLYGNDSVEFSAVNESKPSVHEAKQVLQFNEVGENFFSTMEIPLLAGRSFVNSDADAATCIVSQSAAKKMFPNTPAIGSTLQQFQFSLDRGGASESTCRVIGVAADVKLQDLRMPPQPVVYRPIASDMANPGLMNFVINARSLADAQNAYEKTLREIAPGSPDSEVIPITQKIDDSTSLERVLASLSGFFAGLALLLSGVGLYGLFSRSVTQRTTEFGIRMALGATRFRIVLLVLQQVVILMMIGIVAGGMAATLSTRLIRGFLYGVNSNNPFVLAGAALLLCVIALSASLLPVRKVVHLDPVEALRAE